MKNKFINEARSFYNHRNGYNAVERAYDYSKDALEVYNNVLNKKTMEIIFDSARNEYGLDLNNFEILRAFLYEGGGRRGRIVYGGRPAKERTKFRQPKGQKIPKKEKKMVEKHDNGKSRINHSWRSNNSKKWSKKMRAKGHRQWVKDSFTLLDKDVDRFSSKDDLEYKRAFEPWWW